MSAPLPASERRVPDLRRALGRGHVHNTTIEQASDPRRALVRLALYLRPYQWMLILVLAVVLTYILLGLLEPYLIGRAIDQFISTRRVAGLSQIAMLLLTAYLLDNGFQAISSWIMARISQDALRKLRGDLFAHLQKLPIAYFDSHTAGDLMSRLTNDIDAINQAVSQNVVSLVASVLSLVGILIAMFVLNVWLALAAVLVVPIMLWFTQFVARYTRKGFRDLQKELGEINGVMEEIHQRTTCGESLPTQRGGSGALPGEQRARLQGGGVRQHLCLDAHAGDECVGEPVRHRARGPGRLPGAAGAGNGGHDRNVHRLRTEFHPAAAAAGEHVQRDPGCAGGRGARL